MVVFVVGIMAGLTVMTIGGNPEREFRRDVGRIQQVLAMAQDEAPFAGEEIGFWVDPAGKSYRFYHFDNRKLAWQPYEKEGFVEYKLPSQYRLQVEIPGEAGPVDLAALYKDAYKLTEKPKDLDDEDEPLVPWLVFFSDGNYTPFRLWLSNPHVRNMVYLLEGDGLGDVRIRQMDASKKPDLVND